jgi:5-formyltetrahydrofolate cyclo-ligase
VERITGIELVRWRRQTRAVLQEQRLALTPEERRRVGVLLNERVLGEFNEPAREIVGFYWPIRGEIDLRPAIETLIGAGARAALPVVTGRSEPLAFAEWRPETAMDTGTWNIPIPRDPRWIQPTTLLVATLGFDSAGYRLGYGGGYYDRTLAARAPRPRAIGIAYEMGRLGTICPQEHDLPLDLILTETSEVRPGDRRPG